MVIEHTLHDCLTVVEGSFDRECMNVLIPRRRHHPSLHVGNAAAWKQHEEVGAGPATESIDGGATGTTHGIWNPYDAHIPMLFYGWGIKSGRTNRETYMTDIAPTIAALLHIQMPNGTVGKVVEEVLK